MARSSRLDPNQGRCRRGSSSSGAMSAIPLALYYRIPALEGRLRSAEARCMIRVRLHRGCAQSWSLILFSRRSEMLTRMLAAALSFGTLACGSGYGTPTAPTDPSILFSGTTDGSRTSPGMSAGMATAARATPTTTSVVGPFDANGAAQCAGPEGETIIITGSIHHVFHTTQHADGSFNVVAHNHAHGVAIGTVSGKKSRFTLVSHNQFTFKSAGTFTVTFVESLRIIEPGPSNNLTSRFNLHITILADGRVTASPVNFFDIECK